MVAAIGGSAQLHALAVRIKAAAPTGLRVELLRGLKAAAAPLIPLVHDAAVEKLPHAGGLNEQVAGQKVRVAVRTGAKTAGVRLTTTAPDTKQTDDGIVRHPVFSKKGKDKAGRKVNYARVSQEWADLGYTDIKAPWVTQQIPNAKGWWSETLGAASPLVTPELMAVMESISVQIQGGA